MIIDRYEDASDPIARGQVEPDQNRRETPKPVGTTRTVHIETDLRWVEIV